MIVCIVIHLDPAWANVSTHGPQIILKFDRRAGSGADTKSISIKAKMLKAFMLKGLFYAIYWGNVSIT